MRILPLIMLFIATGISAQGLQQELGYIYVTADYMLETDRYDDAIQEFTKIISKDPSYKDVLYKRAFAKHQVGAFEGTKNDLTQSFEVKGITPEGVLLYAKNQRNMGHAEAAAQSMATAEMLPSGGATATSKSRGSTSETNGDTDGGDSELKDEVKKIEDKISSILDDLLPERNGKADGEEGGTTTNEDNSRTTGTDEVVVEEVEPQPDTSEKDIFIDEDVSLVIKNGLGNRKVLQQPNILILSETTGNVVVDVCVNENGKVTQADYNGPESTLSTQSIISLAVRKAKEFWFEKSGSNETCGTIVYKIKGSS